VPEPEVPPLVADRMETDVALAAFYDAALTARNAWLAEIEAAQPRRDLYEQFREVAEQLANQYDEFELALCAGLVSGTDEAGRRVRRHLLVRRLFARMGERLLPDSLPYSPETRPPGDDHAGKLSVSAAPAIVRAGPPRHSRGPISRASTTGSSGSSSTACGRTTAPSSRDRREPARPTPSRPHHPPDQLAAR
jgi:hypothetical protein